MTNLCNGTGIVICRCGGDICICGIDVMMCPGCDECEGEGEWDEDDYGYQHYDEPEEPQA